jgi:hypothetical protein
MNLAAETSDSYLCVLLVEYRTAVNIRDTFFFLHWTILHSVSFLTSSPATLIILGNLLNDMIILELHILGNSEHTHTHTHTYIYNIYIYIWAVRGVLERTQAKRNISSNQKTYIPSVHHSVIIQTALLNKPQINGKIFKKTVVAYSKTLPICYIG